MAVRKKMSGTDTIPEVEVIVDNTIKYRSDFSSWKEYNDYKGKKG